MSEARKRAERERDVERHVRVTVEAELKAEREAHEETRRERDGYIRKLQETVAKVAENRLDGYRALGQRALDNELRAEAERLAHNDTKSRLAAAEECLREIADACDCGYLRCQSNIARVFLAGGAKP